MLFSYGEIHTVKLIPEMLGVQRAGGCLFWLRLTTSRLCLAMAGGQGELCALSGLSRVRRSFQPLITSEKPCKAKPKLCSEGAEAGLA